MSTDIVQVVIEHDGQLCSLAIPAGRKELALRLLAGVFDNGTLALIKLPDDFKKVRLSELDK